MDVATTSKRRGRPSAEEAEQKRRGLIIAALEEFGRVGFHAASLREIAENAKISSRTLYNYYPDKLSLFEACLDFSGRQIQPVLPADDGDLRSRLIAYATEMQRQLFNPISMQIARLIYREGSEFTGVREIARVQFEKMQVTPVSDILSAHGLAAQRCHDLATQFVAMSLGEWQRRLLFGGATMTDAEMADHAKLVTHLFMDGATSDEIR